MIGQRGAGGLWQPSERMTAVRAGGAGEPTRRPDSVGGRTSRSGPEQPSLWTRRRRRVRATYPQTQAGRPLGAEAPAPARAPEPKLRCSSWSCSRWGLPSRPGHPRRWWSLTPPFHPCPHPGVNAEAVGGLSLWHCPAGHPGWVLPTTLPCGVRTFLSRRPSYDDCRPRPPGRLARAQQCTPATPCLGVRCRCPPARSAPGERSCRPPPAVPAPPRRAVACPTYW